jgi:hypothetical protein
MTKPRELPFYRVLPVGTLQAFERGLHVREMEDKWETRFSSGYLDVYRVCAAEPTYRLLVRAGSDDVEVGPLFLITSDPTVQDDEAHMAIMDLLIARMRGASLSAQVQVLFQSDLCRWSKSIVDHFRARRSRIRRR